MSAVVIKLGSSVVANDDGTVRSEVLAAICDSVAALHTAGAEPIIVTSGAIARGLGVMGIAPAQRPRALGELQAASAVGQGKLYRVYDELLAARGVASAQVLLTFFDLNARTHYLNVRQTLARLLDWRVVPIINENDTTTTDEISFGDNDFLAAQVAILVGAERLLLLTNTDGLFSADPRNDPDARLIPVVDAVDDLEDLRIGQQTSVLGSGGMRSKVVAAEMAAAAGIPTVVANGQLTGTVEAAVRGAGVGTTFTARSDRVSSFKLWLKYAKPSRGAVEVDAGAARALREGGTSLLPVGVVEVSGEFEAGDAIEVTFAGETVGKGISNYSASEMRVVRGMKSADVRGLMPAASEEAVHRDYFVLA
ncbi:MAG: glutamate 5-kinase [Solirubrobacteraceae bacterium]